MLSILEIARHPRATDSLIQVTMERRKGLIDANLVVNQDPHLMEEVTWQDRK